MGSIKQILKLLILPLCLLGLTATASASEYEGVDVSVWQGTIDFVKVKSDGKEVVYIRAGYGLSEDSQFRRNAYSANAAGLNVGYYFFVTAQTTNEAKTQGKYFASLISDVPYNCRPAVDFETFTGLTEAEANAIALVFSETLENETGHTPLFYTDTSAARDLWKNSLTVYPLWIANYGVSEPSSTGHWGTWMGFQYSDVGQVSGIIGDVDLDKFTDAIFLEENGDTLPFKDVPENTWFYGSISMLYNDGLINGTTATMFLPYEDASRTVPITILYRLDASPAVSVDSGFSDVADGLWYSYSVTWAAQNNIAEGYGGGTFEPLVGVTRQETAAFLYRYAVYKNYDTEKRGSLAAYTDSESVADWAKTAMEWAVGTKIIRGISSDELAPESIADRAEIAVMISRFIATYRT